MGPLHCCFSNLCTLLSRADNTRYAAGSDNLAIVVSKLAVDAISFDPVFSEEAKASIEAAAASGNQDSVAALLKRIHDSALGLLRVVYTDNTLIRSTLLPDMLPLLLEAYVSSSTGRANSLSVKAHYCSTDGSPIPLHTIALVSLIQASLSPCSSELESSEKNVFNNQYVFGMRQISSFLSSLFKV